MFRRLDVDWRPVVAVSDELIFQLRRMEGDNIVHQGGRFRGSKLLGAKNFADVEMRVNREIFLAEH